MRKNIFIKDQIAQRGVEDDNISHGSGDLASDDKLFFIASEFDAVESAAGVKKNINKCLTSYEELTTGNLKSNYSKMWGKVNSEMKEMGFHCEMPAIKELTECLKNPLSRKYITVKCGFGN